MVCALPFLFVAYFSFIADNTFCAVSSTYTEHHGASIVVSIAIIVFVMIGDVEYDVTVSLVTAILSAIVTETFSSMSVLFLGIAIYEGYRIPRAQ